MRSAQCMFLVGALVASAAASSEVNCLTTIGPKPVDPVETVTAESTSTVRLPDATTTTAVTETVMAAPVTNTDTTTIEVTVTITEDTITDTYTSTSTETDATTQSVTATVTQTSTVIEVTTSTTTSMIPAPSGFVPVADTANGFPVRKRDSHRRRCQKASLLEPSQYSTPIAGSYSAAQPASSSGDPYTIGSSTLYQTRVQCSVTTTAEQRTVTETSTSLSTLTPEPVTMIATMTVTTTSTEAPRASTTVVETETTTATATATATTTITEMTTSMTTQMPIATAHAACAADSDNFISVYKSGFINSFSGNNMGREIVAGLTSAAQCCSRCFATPGCSASGFRVKENLCLLLRNTDNTCRSQGAHKATFGASAASLVYDVSNGPCGYLVHISRG
ncbi:PAN domain-containing protein [Microdochium nivale]|nr:PAN domain-containing protein [Microdochium nivale]